MLLAAPARAQVSGPAFTFTANTVISPDEVNTDLSTIYTNALNRFAGVMAGNLTWSVDATFDVGAFGGSRMRDLFVGRDVAVVRNQTIGGTLGVTGATTLAALSATTGAFSGNTTIGGTLGVTGAVTLSSTLGVMGATTLSAALGGTSATFSGTVTAATFSGSGASLTSIPETAITNGTILARIADPETISNTWTFDANTTFGTNGSARNVILNGPSGSNKTIEWQAAGSAVMRMFSVSGNQFWDGDGSWSLRTLAGATRFKVRTDGNITIPSGAGIMRPDEGGVGFSIGNGTNISYGTTEFRDTIGTTLNATFASSGGLTVTGTTTTAGLTNSGSLVETGTQDISTTTGNNNNVTVNAGVARLRLTTTTASSLLNKITGLTGGSSGRKLQICRVAGNDPWQVMGLDAGSSSANQFSTTSGGGDGCVYLIYDGGISKWMPDI